MNSTGHNERRTSWTAAELMATEFPEPRWAVPGLVAEGVTLFAGPPKVGKSWLSLGLGIAIASGGRALGQVQVDPGPVLYLALEDTPRRLKTRLGAMLAGSPPPVALTLATECPPLPEGGDQHIARWIDRNPGARLVIIDVFTKVRGRSHNGSQYEADYAAIGRAKAVADAYGIACLLVHHIRKAGSDDFLESVSGTNGLAGASDAILVLKRPRGQADGVLHVTGRDITESEYALAFDPNTGTWRMLEGPASDHALPDTRVVILRHVRDNPGSRPKDIAAATGTDYELTKKTCARMANVGQLAVNAAGRYTAPPGAQGHPGTGTVPAVPGVPELAFPQVSTGVTPGTPQGQPPRSLYALSSPPTDWR
ncbi:MAG TPA: AAA family ATPase [Mycobacteriales bacterium]